MIAEDILASLTEYFVAHPIVTVLGGGFIALLIVAVVSTTRATSRKETAQRLAADLATAHKKIMEAEGEVTAIRERYDDPLKREKAVQELDEAISAKENEVAGVEQEIARLRNDYSEKKAILDKAKSLAAIYDETIELGDLGFYGRHFRFDDSDRYKLEIGENRTAQKAMIKDKTSVSMPNEWVVGGSRAEGKKLETRTFRMMMRAFNGECDAAIAAVTWRNADSIRKRIERAYQQINKENEVLNASIVVHYLRLKHDELELTVEREEKRKEERDALAETRRAEREEKKLLEEQRRAEKEEADTEARLTKARTDAENAVGSELEKLNQKITQMARELEEAHAKAERAKSMAEQTRLGHVYVISNEGSFGPGVFKIGLTRRLDPKDRIKELGDASVPFVFDTHALIFSHDAPALESALHTEFDRLRVNAANMRKEFFRVSLDEVEAAVTRLAPDADFYREAEAQEYHETLMLRQQQTEVVKQELPDAI